MLLWRLTTVDNYARNYRGCRFLLYHANRGHRLPRRRVLPMPFFTTVQLMPWFSLTTEACRASAVISDYSAVRRVPWWPITMETCLVVAVIYRIPMHTSCILILCRGQPWKILHTITTGISTKYILCIYHGMI